VRYSAYGHVIESAVRLPALPPASSRRRASFVVRAEAGCPAAAADRPEAGSKRRTSRAPRLRVTGDCFGYHLRFADGVDFIVSRDGRTVALRRSPGTPLDTARRLLVANVTPLVLSHLGRFVLHASAFATESGIVALLGISGAGKSTLTAYLGLQGVPIVSDDVLVTEPAGGALLATPARMGVSVWPDSREGLRVPARAGRPSGRPGKRRLDEVDGLTFTRRALPIRRMYLLDPSPAARVDVSPLSRRDVTLALASHSYVLDRMDADRLRDRFLRVCETASRVEMRLLRYPRAFDVLPRVREALAADLSS
jgi:hypothetical protein